VRVRVRNRTGGPICTIYAEPCDGGTQVAIAEHEWEDRIRPNGAATGNLPPGCWNFSAGDCESGQFEKQAVQVSGETTVDLTP
jgi:hypothetical protein